MLFCTWNTGCDSLFYWPYALGRNDCLRGILSEPPNHSSADYAGDWERQSGYKSSANTSLCFLGYVMDITEMVVSASFSTLSSSCDLVSTTVLG